MKSLFSNNLFLLAALDPWEALGKNAGIYGNGRVEGTVAIYQLLQRVGLYGCIITVVIFLGTLAFRWGDPRIQSETKEKIIWKFVIAFMICALTFFMSILLDVAQSLSGLK